MFSALPDNSILKKGEPTTFTYNSNTVFQTTWVSTVQAEIQKTLGKYANIKVSRPMGSANFIITVIPNTDNRYALFKAGIESSLDNVGIKDYIFVESEGGTVSSQPGGLIAAAKEVIGDTTSGISSVLWSGVKPLLPWLVLGVAGYIGFQIYLAKQGGVTITNPKRKRKRK